MAMSVEEQNNSRELLEQFKRFYRDLQQAGVDDIASVYSDNIVFRDPVHEIRSLTNLHAYLFHMYAGVKRCHFDYLDELIAEGKAYIKWDMTLEHKKLGDKKIVVRGVSQIEFGEKIHFHEDFYDMGQLLYEHLPVLGSATRWLKQRLSRSAGCCLSR